METLGALMQGLSVAIAPMNLLFALIGVLLGTAVGVLPGIGPALTVALLLPVTYKLDPAGSLIMFAGIYYGACYGGSHRHSHQYPGRKAPPWHGPGGQQDGHGGRGGPALATSAIGSFVAGTIATLGLTFLAPTLVEIAIQFGPEDYFALMCVAFITVSATFGDSPIRGLTSLFVGLALGWWASTSSPASRAWPSACRNCWTGWRSPRWRWGCSPLARRCSSPRAGIFEEEQLEPVRGSLWMSLADWKRSWKPWLRGTALGFPIGALPAGGARSPLSCPMRWSAS